MEMTIDEAITRYKNNAEYERTHGNLQGCLEFRQLVEWLCKYQKIKEIYERFQKDGNYYHHMAWLDVMEVVKEMGMTLNDFETKALQVLLSQRFLSFPLFEEEELSEYHIADNQGEMNLEDFIRQYAEVIMEQFKADYEKRLKADMVAMLTEIQLEIEESCICTYEVNKLIQQKINALKAESEG